MSMPRKFFRIQYTYWLSVRSLLPVVAEPCTPEAAAAAVDPESWCLRSLWTMPISFIHGLLAAWVPMPPLCHIALASLAPYTGARFGLRLVLKISRERPFLRRTNVLLRFVLYRRIDFFRRKVLALLRASCDSRDELGTSLALFGTLCRQDTGERPERDARLGTAILRVRLELNYPWGNLYVLAGAHTAHLQLHWPWVGARCPARRPRRLPSPALEHLHHLILRFVTRLCRPRTPVLPPGHHCSSRALALAFSGRPISQRCRPRRRLRSFPLLFSCLAFRLAIVKPPTERRRSAKLVR